MFDVGKHLLDELSLFHIQQCWSTQIDQFAFPIANFSEILWRKKRTNEQISSYYFKSMLFFPKSYW